MKPPITRVCVRSRAPRSAPFGLPVIKLEGALEAGDALFIAPSGPLDVVSLSATLPEPATLGRGFVIVGPDAGEAGLFSRLLGRTERVPRGVRGSALLLAGFRNIGGGVDPASGLDLCWGEV